MANELNALLNPDNVPGAVSTGYQRQNNNIYAIQTGLDTLSPTENNTSITIEAGGIIEVNGVMFKVLTTTTLNKSGNPPFYVAVTDNGNGTASLSIVTTRGTWNNSKQGYYLPNGARTTNKNMKNTSTSGGVLVYNKTTKGKDDVSLEEGKYRAVLVSGKGGGNGSEQSGGVANIANTAEIIFNHDGINPLQISVGGNGFKGGNGGTVGSTTYGTNGYGGGSGAGEETEIVGIYTTWRVAAGSSASGQKENTGGDGGTGGTSAGTTAENGSPGKVSGGGYGGGGNGGNGGGNSSGAGGGGGGGGSGDDGGAGGRGTGFVDKGGNGGSSIYGANGGNGEDTSSVAGGGGGGAGGAPGWQRPDGSSNAGSIKIYRL
jgi:hypothetical protein